MTITFSITKGNSLLIALGIVVVLSIAAAVAGGDAGNSSEWASWVQAFGSIVAIIGAVWAATFAAKSDRRARDDAALEATINQLIFARAVVSQSQLAVDDLAAAANSFNYPKIEAAKDRIAKCLVTVERLFLNSSNSSLSRILATTYELLVQAHAHCVAALQKTVMEVAYAEVSSTIYAQDLSALSEEVNVLARQIGAPPPRAESE